MEGVCCGGWKFFVGLRRVREDWIRGVFEVVIGVLGRGCRWSCDGVGR